MIIDTYSYLLYKQSENCKQPQASHPFSRRMNILCIDYISITYHMRTHRYVATLDLIPKSALNKTYRYTEGALYINGLIFFECYICIS